jgi:hypothetical protein
MWPRLSHPKGLDNRNTRKTVVKAVFSSTKHPRRFFARTDSRSATKTRDWKTSWNSGDGFITTGHCQERFQASLIRHLIERPVVNSNWWVAMWGAGIINQLWGNFVEMEPKGLPNCCQFCWLASSCRQLIAFLVRKSACYIGFFREKKRPSSNFFKRVQVTVSSGIKSYTEREQIVFQVSKFSGNNPWSSRKNHNKQSETIDPNSGLMRRNDS